MKLNLELEVCIFYKGKSKSLSYFKFMKVICDCYLRCESTKLAISGNKIRKM